ncbi:MAG: DUF3710 domain-containing protein [Jatrophihabitans sp.]
MALRRERNRSKVDDEISAKIEEVLASRGDDEEVDEGQDDLDDLDDETPAKDSGADESAGESRASARRAAREQRPDKGRRRRKDKRTERDKLDATPPWETKRHVEVEATTGPFDITDAPDDDLERVDLGALRIPGSEGLELRVDVDETGAAVAVTLAHTAGHMQIGVFAAPRSEGIWDEVREEIRSSIGSQRGTAQESDGEFGVELTGSIPGDGGMSKVRFVGVDGPRWFVRAMLVGAPATDPKLAKTFNRVIRNLVVVRGTDPLPVRDAIPLTLPDEVAEQIRVAQEAAADS